MIHVAGVPDNRLGLNAQMAAALESPVLGVIDVKPESTAASLCNTGLIAKATMQARGASLMSIVLNGVRTAALRLTLSLISLNRIIGTYP